MNISTPSESQKLVAEKADVKFPSGLIGLPDLVNFQLIVDKEIYPLVILRHTGEEQVDYLAVDPSAILESYNMVIPDTDAEELGLSASGEAPLILNIAIVKSKEPKTITTNLQAPLIINRQTGIGKQILLDNAASYSVEHPIEIKEA